jgi:hypothetical protein
MMTVCFSRGRLYQGFGHDDMTMKKQAKNGHHAMIINTYDDMTIVQVFPRARSTKQL